MQSGEDQSLGGACPEGSRRARNGKKRIGYPQFDLKMIDNLFNSFTCHAVLGNALGFSTRDQHKPNKFYGGKIDRRES
jgi:hypothetical protein